MDKKIDARFDYLRAISAIGVIIIHVCAIEWKRLDVYSYEWICIHIYDMLAKISVPIFFMISGRFYLDLDRKVSIDKIKNKIMRILICFLFWTIIYTTVNVLRVLLINGDLKENIKWIILEFFSGEYHMWFLYAIIGLYLATPILRKVIKEKKITEWYLVLFFIFELFWYVIEQVTNLGIIFITIKEEMNFNFPLGYCGYYVLGYYLYKYPLSKKRTKIVYFLGILGCICTIGMTIAMSWKYGIADETFAVYLSFNIAISAIAVYLCVLSKIDQENSNWIIKIISKYSFGCYLVHPMILWIFEWIGLVPTLFNPLFSVPIIVMLVLLLSIFLTILLKKNSYLRKVV